MKGRKPLYNPENLKIGEKLTIKGAKKQFGHQYARSFSKRFPGMTFKFIDGQIERVA